jgi:hypothetical protein
VKKRQLLVILLVLKVFVFSSAFGESAKKQSALNLIKQKCTVCHDISRVQDLHKTEKDPKTVVNDMRKKEGADISDGQAADIERFMKAPYWQQPLFKGKCTKCHPSKFIFDKCAADPFSDGISMEKIMLMQKKGADITDEQVKKLYNTLRW